MVLISQNVVNILDIQSYELLYIIDKHNVWFGNCMHFRQLSKFVLV